MSSVDTKWKKKIKGYNNTEGLENKEENIKTSRGEKDKAQTKLLYDLKMRIKNIQNKRNGFTKLPHLTDIVDDDGVNVDNILKKNIEQHNVVEGAESGDVVEGAKDKKQTPQNLSPGLTLGLSYGIFMFVYLQLYHLTFKEDIKTTFQNLNVVPNVDVTLIENVAEEHKIPREWAAISTNIADSLSKTLGGWVGDDKYVDIKHNEFLRYMNYLARIDGGIFLRYILIPAQVIVAITQNLIPNIKLIPVIGNKNMFPLIFSLLFLSLYGSTFIGDIDALSDLRKKGTKGNGEWWDFLLQYYARIPIPYFVIVAFIITIAFFLDGLKEMKSGSFFAYGGFGMLGKLLFLCFAWSMSIVLSGLAAIPIGLFALMWIIAPEGFGIDPRNVVDRWHNAIRDNYWVPEWNVCAEDSITERGMWIIRKLWNNKILISTFIVIDLIFKLHYGKGDLINGRENVKTKSLWWWFSALSWMIVAIMLCQKTTRANPLHMYVVDAIKKIHGFIVRKVLEARNALRSSDNSASSASSDSFINHETSAMV